MNTEQERRLRVRAAQLHARLEEAATAHQQLTAENAKLRAELAEAVAALHTLNDEMSAVAYSGFDPERWGERIGALDAAGRVLAKHTTA